MSPCNEPGNVCNWGATQCSCGFNGNWRCNVCPTQQPAVGSACAGEGPNCNYGSTDCECAAGKWICAACPATQPTAQTACTVPEQLCEYGGGAFCRCTPILPNGDRWACLGTCPAQEPAPGAICDASPGQMCNYGNVSCLCDNGTYFCN
jgi:hypothetical protein